MQAQIILYTKKIQEMRNTVIHNLKEISFKMVLLISLSLSFLVSAKAGNDGGIVDIKTSTPLKGSTIVPGCNCFPLTLNQFTDINYFSFGEQSTQQSKTIKNIITFSINEETNKFITQDFTAIAKVKIEYGPSPTSLTEIIKDFKVEYKKAEGAKYDAKQYYYFNDAGYVKITLMQITAPVIGGLDTRDILMLENEMRITRYFELPPNVPAPSLFYHPAPTDPVPDHLTVFWGWPALTGGGISTGNNATQLEWAWIENELEDNYKVNGLLNNELIFKNSSRIDLPYNKITYDIPLLYDGIGKLYYRIRAVNIKESGNRSDGPWVAPNIFAFNGHNNYLNWQVTTTFAEEGKRKTVIQYFDGSLRGRQTVTKDNSTSTNNVVIAESFYDAQGRPAIQILPTPGMGSIIKYQANLNLFNGQTPNQDPAEIFDMEPVATPNSLTPALLTSSGSSKYYSPLNGEINTDANKNIPDAEGYPYTVTRYTPDATGRLMTQSGIGLAHKMGSKHETKYYYGGASQEELDGLFGTEAGNFSHYSKNMVKDANGQMSVSYVDMHGRTIATALAGDAPKDAAGNIMLQALDKNNPAHYPGQSGTSIKRNLLDNTTNLVKGSTIESVNSLLVPAQTDYEFRYELNPQALQLAGCVGATPPTLCYDCLYDLEIAITDETGETPPIVRKFSNVSLNPDDNCNTATGAFKDLSNNNVSNVIIFTQPLGVGSYSIRKTLSISESSFQKYKDLYMSKALCKTEQDFIQSVYDVLLTTSNCGNPTPLTCQNCIAELGTPENYRKNYRSSLGLDPNVPASPQIENDITLAFGKALQNCNMLCNTTSQSLPTIRQMMLADMIPYSGQYAKQDATANTTAGVHSMYDKYNIFSENGLPNQPYFKNPWKNNQKNFYYDDANNQDITIHQDPASPYEFLNTTAKAGFEQLFKNSWTSSLLPHHPEYGRLVFAENNLKTSYDWINTFTQTDSYLTAQGNGYFNPIANDPYFTANANDITLMTAAITNYQNSNVGMWQIAYGDLECKSIGGLEQRTACYLALPNTPPPYPGSNYTAAQNNQAWGVYKGLYAAERTRLVNLYIASQTYPKQLPAADEADLVTQKFRLWFPRDEKQTAGQNGWSDWWPVTPGGDPIGAGTGGGSSGAASTYTDKCSSYINRWKAQLLQCDALKNDANKEAILTEITTRMQAVCVNGSNSANPFGSSNVAPTTPVSVTDRSFEDVIKNVFIAHGIINANGIYTDNYCNPFVIEWPKPYGKGPKMTAGELTNAIDDCNCSQYRTIKAEAVAQNVNVNNLVEFNQYLLANHGDVLTPEMFAALQQNCSAGPLPPECVCKDLDNTIDLYHLQYPNGGLDSCGTTPADLQIDFRTGNQPAQYVASNSITFLPGFESGINDEFIAYISNDGGCDPVGTCHTRFVNFFNTRYNNNPPLTWVQIDNMYQANCGHSPYVCGYTDYGCNELLIVECKFKNLSFIANIANPVDTTGKKVNDANLLFNPCFQIYNNFTDFFNHYYHNIVPLTFAQIQDLYIECDPGLTTSICNTLPPVFCGGPLPTPDCTSNLPYTLAQPVPLPDFLKCGYVRNPRCVSCAGLSTLTGEYKTKFAAQVNTAPIFTGTNLTASQVEYNMNYARFINYRTGFQYNWLDYSKAAGNATPSCNLANYANNGGALQNVICGDAHPLTDNFETPVETPCQKVYTMAVTLGQQLYQIHRQYLLQQFDEAYKAKCLAAKDIEDFTVKYNTSEYHYTLYYYDMAGNLVKTVPPAGVNPNFTTVFTDDVKASRNSGDYIANPIRPAHNLTTEYRYNSLNQVVQQKTPDAGISKFWYDKLGRLVVSQNAKQALANNYSYTLYDELGRIKEVGEKPQAANSMDQSISQNTALLSFWLSQGGIKNQITRTTYDVIATNINPPPAPAELTQQNLRNRVSYVQFFNLDPGADVSFSHQTATYYTYDIHGNVDILLQDYGNSTINGTPNAMNTGSNRFKRMAYDYDLISGKVNMVSYQPNMADAFYHKYSYDAENRITGVLTSRDKIVWEKDAGYTYYKHGPMARTELGQLRVQGTDYSYTLHGWLKGINNTALNPAQDVAGDGTSQSNVAKDVLSYTLHYYDETVNGNNYIDYKPIGTTSPFARPGAAGNTVSLYNGNISAMSVNNAGLLKGDAATNNTMALLYNYRYDQLNRIVSMQAYKGLDAAANKWNAISIDDYKENTSYDPNGNILSYKRNGALTRLSMDDMAYSYKPNTNQLDKVVDAAADASDPDYPKYNDIKRIQPDGSTAGQVNGNYKYDAIGNLVNDISEGIYDPADPAKPMIEWTVYGKIKKITKIKAGVTTVIDYNYDAAGNRISKKVTVGTAVTETYYVKDASGNVMSLYSKENTVNSGNLTQSEVHMYGSSRLGIINTSLDVSSLPAVAANGMLTFIRGYKVFELSNHLQNVLVTISDKKLGVDANADGIIDYYNADVISAQDYYPFGSQMPGRKYSNGSKFRYGFNGKENDNEVKGEGNQLDYGMRIYDPRLGKFLSVDPLTKSYPHYTPYSFAGNKPIWCVDLDGAEEWYYYDAFGAYKKSTLIYGPRNPDNLAKSGYYTLQRIHQIEADAKAATERIQAAANYKASVEAWNNYVASTNLFVSAYNVSGASSIVPAIKAYSNGDIGEGILHTLGAIPIFAELRALNLGRFAIVADFANAAKLGATSFGEIWQVGSNFTRGILLENKLALSIYKGYEHMASVSKFFPTIDFIKDGVGVSLKTVNAQKNFDFKAIFKNIDDLVTARDNGVIQAFGVEKKISQVRLDIAIPKGYDKTVLKDVEKYAADRNITTKIFETVDK
jgi:RHS repeat-associated protein